jgi:hypothetical protein
VLLVAGERRTRQERQPTEQPRPGVGRQRAERRGHRVVQALGQGVGDAQKAFRPEVAVIAREQLVAAQFFNG